ncbi:MAG: helix-turn-helix domain-containing protein [Myxococcota bacterium]
MAYTPPPPNGELDAQSEHEQIRSVLLEVGGNVSRAARRLGKPRSTLRYKIEQLRLGGLIPHD